MAGWIKLHRQIKEHWLWEEKPFDKRSAFTDLILSANHEDKKIPLGNEIIEVKRGSFITSEHKLMERWGWSKTKVRAFLKLLENDSMIVKNTDLKKTTLTITNYSDYQDKETTEELQKNHEKTAKEPQKDPNKNIYILSPCENDFVEILKTVKDYPLDIPTDKDYYSKLVERYPKLNIVDATKDWSISKLDNPLKPNSKPRSQINTWCNNSVKWGKNFKKHETKTTSGGIDRIYNEHAFDEY